MSIATTVTAVGDVRYGFAARQTILSLLERTDFDVHVGCDAANAAFVPDSERVRVHRVEPLRAVRADPFLVKFDSWRETLRATEADIVMHVDADAVVVTDTTEDHVRRALGPFDLAMVEQRGIVGSAMDRDGFRAHFLDHSLPALAPNHPAPERERFRFHNSGVVVFRALELRNFLDWADAIRHDPDTAHDIGRHMIGDQDYLQVWVNVLRGGCGELDWSWNHCRWWDENHPHPAARIVHLSNFCQGPPLASALEMQRLRIGEGPRPAGGGRPSVSFVVVTHESHTVIGDCLAALAQVPDAQITVVDNGSAAGPPDVPDGVELVALSDNPGFAAAANLGARRSSGDIVCFVNPDCTVTLDLVTEALALHGGDPTMAIVPDCVTADGSVSRGVRLGYTRSRLLADILETAGHDRWAAKLVPDRRRDDPSWTWPIAACMFVDRGRFLAVGGFEESYLCYMEDVEFGRAWHRSGGSFSVATVPALHLAATGSAITALRRRELLDSSRLRYARRNFGTAFWGFLVVVHRLLRLARRTRGLRRRGRGRE